MIGGPADAVAEPLVSYFMRRDFLNKAGEVGVDVAEQHPALRGINVRGNGQVNQIRPGLPEIKVRLFGDSDILVRRPAKIKSAHLHLSPGLVESVLGHRLRGHRRKEGDRKSTRLNSSHGYISHAA